MDFICAKNVPQRGLSTVLSPFPAGFWLDIHQLNPPWQPPDIRLNTAAQLVPARIKRVQIYPVHTNLHPALYIDFLLSLFRANFTCPIYILVSDDKLLPYIICIIYHVFVLSKSNISDSICLVISSILSHSK